MPGSVRLAQNAAASTVLHATVLGAVRQFPEAFADVRVPESSEPFRKGYPQVLPKFETARLASAQRADVARYMVEAVGERLVWADDESVPLSAALAIPGESLPLRQQSFSGPAGWLPGIVYQGERWAADQLTALGGELQRRGVITAAASQALAWVADALMPHGSIDLSGLRIAMLGAGAEMAPTRFWLEAGADVLWLDTAPPPQNWLDDVELAGRLYWPEDNVDLLSQPREVLATLLEFAGDQPLHMGLYAYAPGQARELRLTGAMNALVDAMPPALLASVTMLVSPTTPTALVAEDLQAMQARATERSGWEAALAAVGLLGRGGGACVSGSGAATRTVVGIQGASYQAAQYIGKVLAAEHWAAQARFRVSANTAAITRTRSLAHPVFAAAFGGAGAFRIETLTPRQSRRLNGLLALADWLHPNAPVPGRVRVHGGIHTLPYPLEPALRIAAAIGFARSPRLLKGLFSG